MTSSSVIANFRPAVESARPTTATPVKGVNFRVRRGYRMDAWLHGRAGDRRIEFVLHVEGMQVPFGTVPLRRLLSAHERAKHGVGLTLGPNGNLDCRRDHRITLRKHTVDRLAEWAQTAALGRNEGRVRL